MQKIISLLPSYTDYALLLMLRVSGLIFSSPIFGRQSIPQMVKVCFCIAITGVLLYSAPVAPIAASGMFSFILLCLSELVFGVVLGFITTMFFSLTFTAGNIIDNQMGFGMVNVYDPQSGAQVPVTGNLYNIVLILIFFSLGGHLRLIEIVSNTVTRLPIGSVSLSRDLGLAAAEAFSTSFLLAIHVAMPFIASGLLAEVALGVIIRSVPQMNMFVVGMPLKVLIGFVILLMVMPSYIRYSDTIFTKMYEAIDIMFTGLIQAP